MTARRIPPLEQLPPPLFILGHWRSGTTHLYNILSKAPDLGYVSPLATGMPWDLLGLVSWLRPMLERALPAHRFIDNVAVTPDAPQEDEAALANMVPLSFYHGLYFPKHFRTAFDAGVFLDGCDARAVDEWRWAFEHLMRKLSVDQGGRRLVIKNPVYTARVAQIREIFPNAQFVHIRRNPYVVFHSMRNFHIKLSRALGLQNAEPADIDEVVLATYERMMDALDRDTADLPEDRYVDLRYEQLDTDPIGTCRTIYERLGMPGWETAEPRFRAYLDGIKGYRKNRWTFGEDDVAKVRDRWARHIEPYGYAPPA